MYHEPFQVRELCRLPIDVGGGQKANVKKSIKRFCQEETNMEIDQPERKNPWYQNCKTSGGSVDQLQRKLLSAKSLQEERKREEKSQKEC